MSILEWAKTPSLSPTLLDKVTQIAEGCERFLLADSEQVDYPEAVHSWALELRSICDAARRGEEHDRGRALWLATEIKAACILSGARLQRAALEAFPDASAGRINTEKTRSDADQNLRKTFASEAAGRGEI
jgi:hypothetical protein